MTTTSRIYSSFQYNILSDEGPHSSREGSDSHLSNFGRHSLTCTDFRYRQHDQPSAHRSLATACDYSMTMNAHQLPLLDSLQELPNQNSAYLSQYQVSLPPRNRLGHNFPVSHSANTRVALDHPTSMYFYYAPSSARPLPEGMSGDPLYPQQQVGNLTIQLIEDKGTSPAIPSPEPKEAGRKTMGANSSIEPISNAAIACCQCRRRKVRCDSTRPSCHHCVRRSNKCEYDPIPKRRGPDKRPGTRQRSCKKRPADGSKPPPPKRKRTVTDRPMSPLESPPSSNSMIRENLGGERGFSPPLAHTIHLLNVYPPYHTALHLDTTGLPSAEQSLTMVDQSPSERIMQSSDINSLKPPLSPAVKNDRLKWWTHLLTLYPLSTIRDEITYLLEDTGHWLCFVNLDLFLKRLSDEEARLNIQPSFIYAALAMATLMKSSEVESKAPGRERALWLRNYAQISLQVSWQSGWIDATLAEAAFILAMYEASAHPHYTPDRAENSLVLLDNIIRCPDLLKIDAHDSEVCIFPSGCVPITNINSPDKPCSCIPLDAVQHSSLSEPSSYNLPWDTNWTNEQVYQEESRRLCWSSLSLICNHVSQCVAFDRTPPDFFLADPGNYAILFPGEFLDRQLPIYRASDSLSPKESVWALYCRSMLLWAFTNRIRITLTNTDQQVSLIYDAWQEAQALNDAMDKHMCNLDTALIYMSREYIHNTRIAITHMLRSLQSLGNNPSIFKRKHAEEWLRHQASAIQEVEAAIHHLGSSQGYQLTRRPYQMTWFFNQLSICLLLWDGDRTLQNSLTVAKSMLVPVEVMNRLWPCHLLQQQAEVLRERLVAACLAVGMEPPPPLNYTSLHYNINQVG